jgi:tetratricopeptide (TPR) repeat protein
MVDATTRAAAAPLISKLGGFQMAVADCDKAFEPDPQFTKAYTRKADCYCIMNEYCRAKECYNRGPTRRSSGSSRPRMQQWLPRVQN